MQNNANLRKFKMDHGTALLPITHNKPSGRIDSLGYSRSMYTEGNPNSGIWEIFPYGIRNLEILFLWNLQSWALESGIQFKESRSP